MVIYGAFVLHDIETFYKFGLKKKNLTHLHEDMQAGMALMSLAVTESNFLMKMVIDSAHPKINDSIVDLLNSTRHTMLLRLWSAKLFEFITMLNSKSVRESNGGWAEEAASFLAQFDNFNNHPGYAYARDSRNEFTNHYSFSASKKNVKHIHPNADCSLYVHDLSGNGFYPMGEEFLAMGRFVRTSENRSLEDILVEVEAWVDWNLEANQLLNNCFTDIMTRLVIDVINLNPDKIDVWLPKHMTHQKEKPSAPILLRHPDRVKR